MLRLTKLDGSVVYLNDQNIQWMEAMPDTSITFLGGARILVREKIEEVLALLRQEMGATQGVHALEAGAAQARSGAEGQEHGKSQNSDAGNAQVNLGSQNG